jgi:AcrR family transcriptional regulator
MDRLAERLGMSKKTLYVHFPGKEAILRAFVERFTRGLRTRLDAILADPTMDFPTRLRAVVAVVTGALGRVPATLFRDLQRYAPAVFRLVEETRGRVIPRVFAQLMREGMAQGYLRRDLDPDFAAFAWLQLVRGLTQPDALERTGLTLRQTVERAFGLFWPGLLTDDGRRVLAELQAAKQEDTP